MSCESFYYLMHRNDIVATLSFDEITGSILTMGRKCDANLLPPGGNRSFVDLRKWWERRAVPLSQGNIRMLLDTNRIATTQNYLLLNLGLSLTDHYWINPVDRFYRWEEVNLFTNDFKDEFGEFRFKDSFSAENKIFRLKARTSFFPSASLQGELQKKWILQDGKGYLVKGNHSVSCQQSINEVIASMLHEKQGKVPFVKYQLCEIEVDGEKTTGCVCEDFCTEEIEFIPAYEVMESVQKKNEQSEYEHFIDVCKLHGLSQENVRAFLEFLILSDFVLSNVDRHFYNFGILRDTRSLSYIGMAPIFDTGNSLFWNRSHVPEGDGLLNISVNSFKGKETDLLKYVKNASVLDLAKLPSKEEIFELLILDRGSIHDAEKKVKAYQSKIELLERLQNGEKIYQYGYRYGNSWQ